VEKRQTVSPYRFLSEVSDNKQLKFNLVTATARTVVKVFAPAEKLDTFPQKLPLSDDYCGDEGTPNFLNFLSAVPGRCGSTEPRG
jgi:hypothetical protein